MLIYPPVSFSPQSMKQSHLPLGLAYLAAVLRDVCEVRILDAAVEGYYHEEPVEAGGRAGGRLLRYGLPFSEIEKRIAEFGPDLVGASCIFSSQFRNVIEVCRAARRVSPEIITATGGTHPTFLAERCLLDPDLDLVARGEGEFTLRDLVLRSKDAKSELLGSIPGLAWKDEAGKIRVNPAREPFPDLDEIPFPAWDMFPLEKYHKICLPMGIIYKQKPFMNMITSRGCPYRCNFCSSTNFWGNRYRTRSPENVLEEMEILVRDYGIREFKFFDDNLTMDKDRAKKIFRGMIERDLNVTWNTPNGIHVVRLDEDMLDLMKQSGCYELTLAVESGDPYVLRNIIKKPTDLKQVEEAAKRIRKKRIGSYGFFIIGFPGETKEQIQNTLNFSRKLKLDRISAFIANPLPGTELCETALEKGYISDSYSFDDIDYFEGKFDTENWTREDIHRLRRRWFWQYNLGLLVRRPLAFFSRYRPMIMRPRLLFEVLLRRIRS
jgi:anaerobic magnesium-protoporphyrin IX monomethyl ester cyclase